MKMQSFIGGFMLAAVSVSSASAAICPDGSYVSGNTCQIAPDGTYVSGDAPPRIQPNGTYTSGTSQSRTMCPDGSYVYGTCHLNPDGTYSGR